MVSQRKITCDCGKILEPRETVFDGFTTEAMVCSCGFVTLTKEQAQKYVRLKQLHEIIDAERKIIKVGNSMGLTLPDSLRQYGIKVGSVVKLEAITDTAFKIELK